MRKIPFLKTALCSCLALSQPALSQATLEEVIVTAQKTSQSLQDVPISVTAVTGDSLNTRNINELTQLTLAAPTLQVGQDNTFSIRGIGSQISVETVDQSVGLAIDGVSLGRNALAGPFLDVKTVEVLNGPQGLLFGKNASSGLVNVTTNEPVIDEQSGSISSEYVIRDTTPTDAAGYVVKGIFNVPTGENSALRLNALISDQDSIVENIDPNENNVRQDLGNERLSLKAKYLLEKDDFSVYVIADYNENNGAGGRLSRTIRDAAPGGSVIGPITANGITPGPDNLTNDSDGIMFRDVESGGLQANISFMLGGDIELINIAAYRYFESDQNIHSDFSSYRDILDNPRSNDYDQFSNELRFVFPANDVFRGQAGLYYFQSESTIDDSLRIQGPLPDGPNAAFPFCVNAPVVSPGPPPNCNVSNVSFLGTDAITDLEATSYAVFGQFDFFPTEKLTLTAGARVTVDELSSRAIQTQRNYFVNIGGPRGEFYESVDNTNLSWKLGGQYNVTDDVMTYVSLGQGYKAPGFNTDNLDIPEVPFAVEEEVSTTLEAGIKTKFADDRVILNVSAFYTEFDDYQAQSFNLEARGFLIQNASSVTAQGAELSLTALLTDEFTLSWDVAFLDSAFDDFEFASCSPDTRECAPGQEFFDASGYTTPLSADVTSTLQGLYERSLTDSVELFTQASMYYRSNINYGIASPTRKLDNVSIFNFSAGVVIDNGMRFSIFCKNCTDEKVPTSIAFDPGENNRGFATTQQTWGLDSVRSIGLTASYEF